MVWDERVERDPPTEQAMMVARKRDEEIARVATYKNRIAVFGGAVMGAVGIIVVMFAAWRENVVLTAMGAAIGLVSFGVITIAQAGVLFGKGGSSDDRS